MSASTDSRDLEARIATSLAVAHRTAAPIASVRLALGDDLDAAYRVQSLLVDVLATGAQRTGRKIGLTSTAVQRQLGVDQPDFGVLLDTMSVPNGGRIDASRYIAPRVEAEVAFVLAHDIEVPTMEAVRHAVDHCVAALEIVDSRIADWNIGIVDTVADNASSAAYVLGPVQLGLDEVEPRDVTMRLDVDGREASTGSGVDCLGDPLAALLWVATTAIRLGDPLRAGELVLSGALGPMAPLRAGEHVAAHIDRLGTVEVTVAGKEEE